MQNTLVMSEINAKMHFSIMDDVIHTINWSYV